MINEGVKMWPVNSTYYHMHDVDYEKKTFTIINLNNKQCYHKEDTVRYDYNIYG